MGDFVTLSQEVTFHLSTYSHYRMLTERPTVLVWSSFAMRKKTLRLTGLNGRITAF